MTNPPLIAALSHATATPDSDCCDFLAAGAPTALAESTDPFPECFSAAVDFLGNQSSVDRQQIGAIGICGSGNQAHSREFSEDVCQRAAEPKELYVAPGTGHVDLDDRSSRIPFDKFTSFFSRQLVAASA